MKKSGLFSKGKMTRASAKKMKGWGIFAGCAMVALLAIHFLMVVPVDEERGELQARIEKTTQTIKLYRKKVAEIPEITKDLDSREAKLKGLLKKYPAGVKSETLEQELNKKFLSLRKFGLKTTSFLPMAARERKGFSEVSYKFNFLADINGLSAFLKNLKGFSAPVNVKDIEIQVSRDELQYPLRVNVVLETLLRK